MQNGTYEGQACLNVQYNGFTSMVLIGWTVSDVNYIGGFNNLWA